MVKTNNIIKNNEFNLDIFTNVDFYNYANNIVDIQDNMNKIVKQIVCKDGNIIDINMNSANYIHSIINDINNYFTSMPSFNFSTIPSYSKILFISKYGNTTDFKYDFFTYFAEKNYNSSIFTSLDTLDYYLRRYVVEPIKNINEIQNDIFEIIIRSHNERENEFILIDELNEEIQRYAEIERIFYNNLIFKTTILMVKKPNVILNPSYRSCMDFIIIDPMELDYDDCYEIYCNYVRGFLNLEKFIEFIRLLEVNDNFLIINNTTGANNINNINNINNKYMKHQVFNSEN